MPTPPKPVIMLEQEKKSHRTKAEKAIRKQAEKSTISGKKLTERPEVNSDPIAHKEYLRVSKLMASIEKDDALYTNIINRYCQLHAECRRQEEKLETLRLETDEWIEEHKKNGTVGVRYLRLLSEVQKNISTLESICNTKRKMMLDIEKECLMTIASALRSIPKKPEKEKNEDPMEALLTRRRA